MNKTMAVVGLSPRLKAYLQEQVLPVAKQAKEREHFLKAQLKNHSKECEVTRRKQWHDMIEICRGNGLVEQDFVFTDSMHLHMSDHGQLDSTVLTICDGSHDGFDSVIKALFGEL